MILGIIGGIAPESTVEYYRTIVRLHQERANGAYPTLLINSIDLTKMIGFAAAGEFDRLVDYLSPEIQRLADGGATLGILASNTPHLVFDRLSARSPIPLISIVDCAADTVEASGIKRVALFGTRFTMQGSFYKAVFAKRGIEIVVPQVADQDEIHTRYMNELVRAEFLESTRARMLAIIEAMQREHAIEGVLLAGTELPLLLRTESWNGVRLFDTGRLHCEVAVERILAERGR